VNEKKSAVARPQERNFLGFNRVTGGSCETTVLAAISFAVLPCLWGSAASAADYDVDSGSGDDANSGHSANAAWRSLAALNRVIFKPGDSILLAAGSRYTG
jgi:hypothetical protein